MSAPHWTKQYRGFYTLDGTEYGVASAHATSKDDAGTSYTSATEWVVIRGAAADDHNAGENLDWFDTMKEAKADAERRASR